MKTIWGEALDRNHPLPEYPRPQLQREKWLNLNGVWSYAICQTTADEQPPKRWDGEIVVPFSPESELSGVQRTLHVNETLWYRRSFTLPPSFLASGNRLLLHFGAVDQEATVYVNGTYVGEHHGGYNAFTLDATESIQEQNILIVQVHDDTDASWHSRGKQKTKRGGIWYTPQSGIWQTVWLEPVPKQYIQSLTAVPLVDEEAVLLTVHGNGSAPCTATIGEETYTLPVNCATKLSLANLRLWQPDDPYLYDLTVIFGEDRVQSYFGMRKTEVRADENGTKRLFLNNKPFFHNGLLDQGYWPDGLYTPPSDEAMLNDIKTAKKLGYTMLRKHIKVEPMRWYYHCDRLGMLVWQDMVNGGEEYRFSTISFPLITGIHHNDHQYRKFARQSQKGRNEYLRELQEMIKQLINVPSIVLWVPFNEGWGQFDAAEICERIKALDPSRPVDHASGWHDQKAGDFKSLHVYFKPYRFSRDKWNRAVALSEFGGYNLRMDGHCWNAVNFGYKKLPDQASLWSAYEKLYREEVLPAIPKGLSASVYTQLTDVEDEVNGIMTYDRKLLKLPEDSLKSLNQEIAKCGCE
ncbi:MAG: glycoside hydrolase family 2 TIM barrel-domain containing protein [Eubacteriales bacterium]|nr:glycoside hydrolase family 2 TIM barrel-domain containing protein [Eubacteriales bacterium]